LRSHWLHLVLFVHRKSLTPPVVCVCVYVCLSACSSVAASHCCLLWNTASIKALHASVSTRRFVAALVALALWFGFTFQSLVDLAADVALRSKAARACC